MTTQLWTLPVGYSEQGVSGNSVLTIGRSSTGTGAAWYLVNFAPGGTDTVTPVTGLPAGATVSSYQVTISDAAAMIVRYTVSGALQYGLLDLATATITPIPATPGVPVALSADRVAFYDATSETVTAYSRAGLLDGTDTAATIVALPGASGSYDVALAGDHVIAVPGTGECACSYAVQPALDVPLSGAAAGQALAEAQTGIRALAQGPDGAALLVGGTGAADWSVHRLTVGASDQLSDTAVLPLTGPMTNGGLTISEGLVRHVEVQPVPGGTPTYRLFNHLLVPDTSGFQGPGLQVDGGQLAGALPCATGATCVHTVDGNWYGTSFLAASSANSTNLREVIDGHTSSTTLSLGSAGGTVADAGVNYVIVNGVNPAHQLLGECRPGADCQHWTGHRRGAVVRHAVAQSRSRTVAGHQPGHEPGSNAGRDQGELRGERDPGDAALDLLVLWREWPSGRLRPAHPHRVPGAVRADAARGRLLGAA